jgi:hypothetical protein
MNYRVSISASPPLPFLIPFFTLSITAFFALCFNPQGWNRIGLPGSIQGYVGQNGAARMVSFAAHGIFGVDLHADFHGGSAHIIHGRIQDGDLSKSYGGMEFETLHRGRHNRPLAMPECDDGRNHIDPMHDPAAEDVSQRIRVIGEDNLERIGGRFRDRFFFHKRHENILT